MTTAHETQERIANTIARHEAKGYVGPLLITKVAQETGVDVAAVTAYVARLIARGMARRYASHGEDEFVMA